MKRSTFRLIIVLATILFIGLVSSQIVWVKRAYDISSTQLEHEIELALISVVKDVQRHSADSSFLVDPVTKVGPNLFRVQINEELYPDYLESLLKTEFLNRELNFDFQYSIYDCFNDSVVFTRLIVNAQDESDAQSAPPKVEWEDDGHYFSVFFPTLEQEVLGEMKFWVASSILLLAVVVFFAFVINIILKQKRLSEIKNDFINNMTHELKTPISTIALSSDILLKPDVAKDPQRLQSYAQIIKNENQRLQNQVERVLQVARLEKEETELNLEIIDMHELAEAVSTSVQMNYPNLQIEKRLKAPEAKVLVDELHMTNVLFNLLDNAAKYAGEDARVTIASEQSKSGIKLSVADNGPGIPREHQKAIFEKFYRIPTGNRHDVKGFGLGLHYVKTILEAHGGSVKVRSAKEGGCEFELHIPYGTKVDYKNSSN